ncbi:MAG: Sb-PDE family phosphodiesterase [Paludibacter sp.]
MRNAIVIVVFLTFYVLDLQTQSRKEIDIPNIPGYVTLKCDFHVQTIFSDGEVWPTVRVNEAWEQGLDVLAITDVVEYQPKQDDTKYDHNQSYEIARPLADQLGIILIRGAELNFKMIPGHLDAIFIKNANLLVRDSWQDALQECKDQDAFVFWDHPEIDTKQPEKSLWWNQYVKLFPSGVLGGVEVYNEHEFFPEAFKWASKKGLTLLANSNVKGPIEHTYQPGKDFRPVTLVFATERKAESVLFALRNRHTAIYFDDKLLGNEKFLGPIFYGSVKVVTNALNLKNNESKFLQIHNYSDIDYSLSRKMTTVGFSYQTEVVLKAHSTTLVEVVGTSDEIKNKAVLKLDYEVTNLITAPGEKLQVTIDADNL